MMKATMSPFVKVERSFKVLGYNMRSNYDDEGNNESVCNSRGRLKFWGIT